MTTSPDAPQTAHARQLRAQQTHSEGLLWSVLRARQVCGLKFRRQHRIGPWIADFACVERKLVVEIDGGYHDQTASEDLRRQADLQQRGWQVIRFTDAEVERDAEAVARAIARELNVEYEFKRRNGTGAGMKKRDRNKPR